MTLNLVLAGPPGSGKTTLGAAAAQALGRPFIDGDAWIEAHWGRPVPDYFASGEADLFRAREVEAYRTLADQLNW
jgi:shikimate kinase